MADKLLDKTKATLIKSAQAQIDYAEGDEISIDESAEAIPLVDFLEDLIAWVKNYKS